VRTAPVAVPVARLPPAKTSNDAVRFARHNLQEYVSGFVKLNIGESKGDAMKSTLQAGIAHQFEFCVPENKIVANLYPESPEFQRMPRVLATGFLVGLIEWTCIQAVNPHLEWPEEQTVGIGVNVSHVAPTPPGIVVTVRVKLEEATGKKLTFSVIAEDERGTISEGIHERFVINAARFNEKVRQRLAEGSV